MKCKLPIHGLLSCELFHGSTRIGDENIKSTNDSFSSYESDKSTVSGDPRGNLMTSNAVQMVCCENCVWYDNFGSNQFLKSVYTKQPSPRNYTFTIHLIVPAITFGVLCVENWILLIVYLRRAKTVEYSFFMFWLAKLLYGRLFFWKAQIQKPPTYCASPIVCCVHMFRGSALALEI
jgi:hypothetical protein